LVGKLSGFGDRSAGDAVPLGQELFDLGLHLAVGALAKMLVADKAVGVDQVDGGPVAVVVGVQVA